VNRAILRNASRDLIWWLMAEGVTFRALAAWLKLPRREAASKLRRQVSGGRRLILNSFLVK